MSQLGKIREIGYQKITRKMDLGEFNPIYKGIAFDVWVNIQRADREEYAKLQEQTREASRAFQQYIKAASRVDDAEKKNIDAEIEKLNAEMRAINDRVYAWYAKVWGEEAEKVREFAKEMVESEMGSVWKWMTERTWALITMHLEGLEKN